MTPYGSTPVSCIVLCFSKFFTELRISIVISAANAPWRKADLIIYLFWCAALALPSAPLRKSLRRVVAGSPPARVGVWGPVVLVSAHLPSVREGNQSKKKAYM